MESFSPLLASSDHPDETIKLSFQESTVTQPEVARRKGVLAAICRVIVVLFAVWGMISLSWQLVKTTYSTERPPAPDVYRPWTLEKDMNFCNCGASIDEALSRDCTYDALAAAWLPPHCRDNELTAQFSRAGPGPDGSWSYYADAKGGNPITELQIAALGEGSFWVTRDWHIQHCLFYWEKYMRMRVTGVVMEARFDNIPHVKHCGHLLTKPPPDHWFLIEVKVTMNSRPSSGRPALAEPEEVAVHDGHHSQPKTRVSKH